ncbi:MAG: beta-galactosidase [Kiritimatiellae bacterium]|nr:beta-galactosidase [Kiritimatiellia bacterium]
MKFKFVLLIMVAAFMLGCHLAVDSNKPVAVRVQDTAGGPRIHVDGQPIPPRFFAGFLGGSHRTDKEWREVSFDFSPAAVEKIPGEYRIHIRFNDAADFLLKDICVTDLTHSKECLVKNSFNAEKSYTKVWSTYQAKKTKKAEPTVITKWTPEGVSVSVQGEVSGWWPTYQLRTDKGALKLEHGSRYQCRFKIRSSKRALVNVMAQQMIGGRWQQIGPPSSDIFDTQLKMAREAGIRLCHVQMPTCFEPPEKPQNWEALDQYFQHVISVVPDALIVPRISADVPSWWIKRYPGEAMVYEDGSRSHKATVNSPRYRQDMCAHFEKLCRHLCETFPKNFAGILPLGQGTYEWYYEKSLATLVSGFDPATETAWHKWLKAQGRKDASSIPVPSAALRHGTPNGMLRDPGSESDLIDFARFRQEQMADMVLELAAACRRGTAGKKMVLFFYGYLFEMGMCKNGAYDTGHYALSRVLASDDIDILCAPLSYTGRAWGSSSASMTATESVLAAGKLWLNEDDCRTYLAGTSSLGGVDTLEKSIDILRRSRGQALIRGFADWWLDIRDMGWHDDPAMWKIQHQINPAEKIRLASRNPYSSEIAMIVDEDSMVHLSGKSKALAMPLVYKSRDAFGCSGAPYSQLLLDDIASGRMTPPLQFFLAAWSLTDKQRDMLHKNRGKGVTRVWCHAPGYIRSGGFSTEGIRDVTGFKVEAVDLASAVVTPTDAGKALGLIEPWGPATRITPLFKVIPEAGDRVLATYSDGAAAMVVRSSSKGTDVYLATPCVTSPLIRALARMSGVHLFTDVNAGVWAKGDLASIHVMADGPLKVHMKRAGRVCDLYSGRVFGDGLVVEIPSRKGETLLLRVLND